MMRSRGEDMMYLYCVHHILKLCPYVCVSMLCASHTEIMSVCVCLCCILLTSLSVLLY